MSDRVPGSHGGSRAPHSGLLWRQALPPLTIYLAAGLSGITSIVGTFFVKEHLGLTAEFIASLGFWISLPWSFKMALGHAVDLVWRYRAWLVLLGAALASCSAAILWGLLTSPSAMAAWMPADAWYVWSAVLAPLGYVLQDVVADAMTIDAVPRFGPDGAPIGEPDAKAMHTTMQALSRATLIAGGLAVGLLNLLVFTQAEPGTPRLDAYRSIVGIAVAVPLLPVLGLLIARLRRQGPPQVTSRARIDGLLLGGGIAFAVAAVALGVTRVPLAEWWVFVLSMLIAGTLVRRLLSRLPADARRTLVGTAVALFVFRAMPDPGPGPNWWMIDRLQADERFFALLSILGSVLALAGLWLFRRWMAQRSVAFTVVALTLAWTVLSLPTTGLYFGLHEWLLERTQGLLGGRAVVVADTAALSLLSEIAMVPMLAWVARTAPQDLKATYFAVMISFANLGLLLSRLSSGLLNGVFVVTREVRDASGAVVAQADYSELGTLVAVNAVVVLVVPVLTIALLARTRYRSG